MTPQDPQEMELSNILTTLKELFPENGIFAFLSQWQSVVYALIAIGFLWIFARLSTKKMSFVPGRLQSFAEIIAQGVRSLVLGVLGPQGEKYVPFLGTLFIYILTISLMGLIPFLKSPASSWSTTLALALCVFGYVQYTAIRHLGFLGYMDHLAGKPRGALAFSIVLPVFMFTLHFISEFLKPISLSLRLRSNIWGDDLLLAVLTHFGLQGFPLLFLNTVSALLMAFIQAIVFFLLSTIYFASVLTEE